MRTIFESCEPRPEVLSGELKEEIFAARLKDVIDGKAEDVYQKPDVFFDNSYPTAGFRLLLQEALGRLTGLQPTNNPVIRLETAFGGGKTHNLIALYHAANGDAANLPKEVLDPTLVPAPGSIAIAGVVGSDLDPSSGIRHGNVTTFTLWGELAFQLGGEAGYELVAESDLRSRAAPGTGVWSRLVGERPTLILLDEIARHLRSAKAIPTATGRSDLAEQTVAFLMSLLEFAASRDRVVVVLTLADLSDAFNAETDELKQELAAHGPELTEARGVSARQERVITSVGEAEIAAIVNHRLFRRIDPEAARETAEAYHGYYERLLNQGADLPQRAARAEYAAEMARAYPFHPELVTALNRKVSTIPNFQKTRGALRLLALAIRRLWEQRPADAFLIHPHHVDLGLEQIADDLTSRLQRHAYKQVIEADIASSMAGSRAHAQTIDDLALGAGKTPYARRLATTVFLHSLTQGIASGVDPADLMLAVIQPEDDPTVVGKSLERLVDDCWFLDYDGHRYRFKTEPSLNKIVADEVTLVGKTKAKADLDQRIRGIWKKGVFEPVFFPSEAADIDDDAKPPKLAVIHYDAASATATDPAPPDLVRKLFDYAGTLEGYRNYKNNVLFLVADREQVENMVEVARRHLAIARIAGDAERMKDFTEEQRKKLKAMQDASELEVRVAITKAYRYLYYPSADAPAKHGNLERETLPAQEQGEVEKDQSNVLLRLLRQLEKVLTAEDKPLAAAYLKAKAWDAGQPQMSTEDLRRAFARRLGLRILLDPNQLKRTIRDGVQQGLWVYYDSQEQMGYGGVSPAPLVQIGVDTLLYTPEEAARLGIKIKGQKEPPLEEKCPVCGKPVSQCSCGDVVIIGKPKFQAEGAPAQAFQAIFDQCRDRGVARIKRLSIRSEGSGKAGLSEVRALGLAVPQLGKGQFRVEQSLGVEFGPGEQLSLNFSGNWERYKRVKTITDNLGQEATKATARTVLHAEFPEGLDVTSDQFQTAKEVFANLGMGKLALEAEPEEGTTA